MRRYFDYAFGDLEELTLTPDIYENARKKLEEDYNDNRTLAQEKLAAQRKELAKIDSQSQTINRHLISGTIKPDAYTEMRDSLSFQKAEVESRIAELEQAEEVFVDFACESLKLITDFKIKYLRAGAIGETLPCVTYLHRLPDILDINRIVPAKHRS